MMLFCVVCSQLFLGCFLRSQVYYACVLDIMGCVSCVGAGVCACFGLFVRCCWWWVVVRLLRFAVSVVSCVCALSVYVFECCSLCIVAACCCGSLSVGVVVGCLSFLV